MASLKQLNIRAGVSQTGYGSVGYNALEQLTRNFGWDIYLKEIGTNERKNPREAELIYKSLTKPFFYDAPCLQIWHQFALEETVGRGDHYAFVFCELDGFSKREIHHMNYADRLIVSSQWAKDMCLKYGIKSEHTIDVVPLGVNKNLINSEKIVQPRNPGPTTFLSSGKWEIRKGHDVLLEAFNKAFTKDDNVLLLKTGDNPYVAHVGDETQRWVKTYHTSPLGRAGRVKVLPWFNNQGDLHNLMSQVDCGVFLSRGEAWNLGLLEMMAMGKQIIATNNTGHTEFCDKYNSLLVETDLQEEAFDGMWFKPQAHNPTWSGFTPENVDQVVEHMRYVHNAVQSPGDLLNEAAIDTASGLTWENTFGLVDKILCRC